MRPFGHRALYISDRRHPKRNLQHNLNKLQDIAKKRVEHAQRKSDPVSEKDQRDADWQDEDPRYMRKMTG